MSVSRFGNISSCFVTRINQSPSSETISNANWRILEDLAHYICWDSGYWSSAAALSFDDFTLPDCGHRPIWGTELLPGCVMFSIFLPDLAFPLTLDIYGTDAQASLQINQLCAGYAFYLVLPTMPNP
jgi:hypothetical protein